MARRPRAPRRRARRTPPARTGPRRRQAPPAPARGARRVRGCPPGRASAPWPRRDGRAASAPTGAGRQQRAAGAGASPPCLSRDRGPLRRWRSSGDRGASSRRVPFGGCRTGRDCGGPCPRGRGTVEPEPRDARGAGGASGRRRRARARDDDGAPRGRCAGRRAPGPDRSGPTRAPCLDARPRRRPRPRLSPVWPANPGAGVRDGGLGGLGGSAGKGYARNRWHSGRDGGTGGNGDRAGPARPGGVRAAAAGAPAGRRADPGGSGRARGAERAGHQHLEAGVARPWPATVDALAGALRLDPAAGGPAAPARPPGAGAAPVRPPASLPPSLTSFVGRERELAGRGASSG